MTPPFGVRRSILQSGQYASIAIDGPNVSRACGRAIGFGPLIARRTGGRRTSLLSEIAGHGLAGTALADANGATLGWVCGPNRSSLDAP